MALKVCKVGTAAARKFGLLAKRVQNFLMWSDLVDFTLLYGVHNQGYFQLVVVASIYGFLSFGAMCRYNVVSQLKWGNIKFESDLSSLEVALEIRKNSITSKKQGSGGSYKGRHLPS